MSQEAVAFYATANLEGMGRTPLAGVDLSQHVFGGKETDRQVSVEMLEDL